MPRIVSQTEDGDNAVGRPGVGVDARGGAVIDPTRNVLDLVRAESKYQDAQRDSQDKLLNEKVGNLKDMLKLVSDSMIQFQNAQRESETRRIDQLASTRQEFQNTIRDMLAESVRTTSTLVSTQLVQIQATFDTRVSKLEAGAFTAAGKSSVADPAISDAITRMMSEIRSMKIQQDSMMTADSSVGGVAKGREAAAVAMNRIIMIALGVGMLVLGVLGYIAGKGGHIP
jgi:hypothetical protein